MQESRVIGSVKGNGGPGSGTIREFRDWEKAAEFSVGRKAISREMLEVVIAPFNRKPAMRLKVHLVMAKPGRTMSYVFHSAQGIPADRVPKPHARDIDRVTWWRSW